MVRFRRVFRFFTPVFTLLNIFRPILTTFCLVTLNLCFLKRKALQTWRTKKSTPLCRAPKSTSVWPTTTLGDSWRWTLSSRTKRRTKRFPWNFRKKEIRPVIFRVSEGNRENFWRKIRQTLLRRAEVLEFCRKRWDWK